MDGFFAKCWIREDGQIQMLKRGFSGASNMGVEAYSTQHRLQNIFDLVLISMCMEKWKKDNRKPRNPLYS